MYNGQRTKVRYLRKRMGFCVFVFTAVASHKVKKKKKKGQGAKIIRQITDLGINQKISLNVNSVILSRK